MKRIALLAAFALFSGAAQAQAFTLEQAQTVAQQYENQLPADPPQVGACYWRSGSHRKAICPVSFTGVIVNGANPNTLYWKDAVTRVAPCVKRVSANEIRVRFQFPTTGCYAGPLTAYTLPTTLRTP